MTLRHCNYKWHWHNQDAISTSIQITYCTIKFYAKQGNIWIYPASSTMEDRERLKRTFVKPVLGRKRVSQTYNTSGFLNQYHFTFLKMIEGHLRYTHERKSGRVNLCPPSSIIIVNCFDLEDHLKGSQKQAVVCRPFQMAPEVKTIHNNDATWTLTDCLHAYL